jgi:hypothetical protein
MSQGAYIILPINPEQFSIDLPIRISNDQARALQVQYIWRDYDRDGTSFVLPTLSLSVPSGYIVPSFDPAAITETRKRASAKSQWLNPSNGFFDAAGAQQFADEYETTLKDGGYLARIPSQEMTRDYIGTGLYREVGVELQPNPLLTDSAVAAPGSSGNLPGLYTEANKHIPLGIQNLYAMFSLMDERRIRKTDEERESRTMNGAQTENRAMLIVSTPAFPKLVCYGWFGEDGLKYSESADEPTSFNMDFSFIVTETEPALGYGQWESLAANYASEITSPATTLDIARQQWPNGTKAATPRTNMAPGHTMTDKEYGENG